MTTVSNVSTTEYSYTPVQIGEQASVQNSVFTSGQPQNSCVDEEKNLDTSKYSEEKKKLVDLAQKYGVDLNTVFNCDVEALSDDDCKRLFEALDSAITKLQDKSGKVDVKKVGELASQYNIALLTGWSVKGFDDAQNGRRESIEERLKRAVSAKDVEEALDKYYNHYFEKELKAKLANAKTPEEREKIIKKEHLRQLQDFGRLLANTPQEKREIFVKAAKSLYANNRLPGLAAAFEALNMTQKTNAANNFSNEEIAELGSKKDQFGEVSGEKEIQGIARIVNRYKDKEHSKEDWNKTFGTIAEFEKSYDDLKSKEANGELSEEEKEVLKKYEVYKAIISGGTVGTAENRVIPENAKLEILQDINTRTLEVSENYQKEVLKKVAEYVEENQESLSISREELDKILDKATDNKYSQEVNVYREEKEAAKAQPQADLGFTQQKQVDTTRLEELKAKVNNDEEKQPAFKVERKYADNPTITENSFTAKLSTMKEQDKLSYIASNFSNFGFGLKTRILNGFKQLGHQTLMQILPSINNDSFILGIYKTVGLTSEDIEKLNVSIGAKNIMLAELEKREENQPA